MAAAATAASAADPTSFVIGEGKFVKDEFAVYSNGVARHGRQKVFAVDPADLQRGAMIGRGVSSVVQLALHKPTQTVLALKVGSARRRDAASGRAAHCLPFPAHADHERL